MCIESLLSQLCCLTWLWMSRCLRNVTFKICHVLSLCACVCIGVDDQMITTIMFKLILSSSWLLCSFTLPHDQCQNQWRNRVLGNLAPSDPHSYVSWDKSKNSYQLRNHIIPNAATAGAPGTTRPMWSHGSWALVIASGIMQFLSGYGHLLYFDML